MRIVKISVTKLFGTFDHVIPLNVDEQITIIHGKNGVGKTSLLKLINGFFNLKYSELRAIPFAEFRIDFDDHSSVVITQEEKNKEPKNLVREIKFSFVNNQGTGEFSPAIITDDNLPFPITEIDDINPDLQRVDARRWLYRPTMDVLSLEQVLERFEEYFPEKYQLNAPEWLQQVRDSVNVYFIESQRLFNRTLKNLRTSTVSSVTTYSQELAENIQAKLAEYGSLSQDLDRSFPKRVMQKQEVSTEAELKSKLDDLESKRQDLIEEGLLKSVENDNVQIQDTIDDSTRKLLSVYAEDAEQKLNVFREIAPKIELFKSIINKKFSYKSMVISQDKGFLFKTHDEHTLSPIDLSSGEQHELVILYELLFKVEPNSLILIDKPEISLHVEWKRQFLEDLQEITKLAHLDVLISTHSPTLIHDRWDLTVALK